MNGQSQDGGYALDSGRLQMAFDATGAMTRFAGTAGENRLARAADTLWTLDLRGPAGPLEANSRAAALRAMEPTEDGLLLTWGVPLGGAQATVTVGIRLAEGSPLSQWSLSVDLPDGYTLAGTQFPYLPGLARHNGMRLAVPQGWGVAVAMEPGLDFEAPYPSCQAAMQFVAMLAEGETVYLATHDPEAHFKTFRASADERTAALTLAHWPETGSGRWSLAYEVTLGVLPGGWYEAARVYREFALTAPWNQAPLARRDIPQWLRDAELWLKPGETPWTDDDEECRRVTFENVETCIRARDFFGVPIALHWYRWHRIPYDVLYPEYFPAKAGFYEGVKAAQEAGFPVMPYINGRLCDPETDTWKKGASEWAARDEDDRPYTELYGSQVPLNAMCPSTPEWQDTVTGLVRRLVDEVGVDGVYIDQIGAASPCRCMRTDHGHAPGGGAGWVKGYRALLEKARAVMPEGKALTTEENAEPWMDQFDGYLVVNTHTNMGEVLPLFPAVYAGRCVTFGFQYTPITEPAHAPGFSAKMARAFLWGAQLGWIDAARLMAPEARHAAEFVRQMCRVRRQAHDFLMYGDFLGPVAARGDFPRITDPKAAGSFGGTYALDLPAVMATAWRAEDGRLGIAVVNMDAAPRAATLDLPLAAAGIAPDAVGTVTVIGPDGPVADATPADGAVRLEIPPRDARFLVLSPVA